MVVVVVDFMRGQDVYGCAISSLFVWELWNARACSLENVPSLLGKIINFKLFSCHTWPYFYCQIAAVQRYSSTDLSHLTSILSYQNTSSTTNSSLKVDVINFPGGISCGKGPFPNPWWLGRNGMDGNLRRETTWIWEIWNRKTCCIHFLTL